MEAEKDAKQVRHERIVRLTPLFIQLTAGCGRPTCRNSECCVSGGHPVLDPTSAAVVAVRLIFRDPPGRVCLGVVDKVELAYETAVTVELLKDEPPEVVQDKFRSLGFNPLAFAASMDRDEALDPVRAELLLHFLNESDPKISESFQAELSQGLGSLHQLKSDASEASPLARLKVQFLTQILQWRQLLDPDLYETLLPQILNELAQEVPSKSQRFELFVKVTKTWTLEQKNSVVQMLQQYLTITVEELGEFDAEHHRVDNRLHESVGIRAAAQVLNLFSDAQQEFSADSRVSPAEFVNLSFSEMMLHGAVHEDVLRWMVNETSGFCYCRTAPAVLSTDVKATVLEVENRLSQRRHGASPLARLTPLAGFTQVFGMHVRRANLIEDTLRNLEYADTFAMRRRLHVRFEGEEGIDAGGVQKEYFMLIVREIFDPKYGMFQRFNEDRIFWFNPDSNDLREFELIGTILGLAIYNAVILDLHFPPYLFRRLAKHPADVRDRDQPDLSDLRGLDPELARGLQAILDYDGPDFEGSFSLTFEVTREVFGERRSFELIPSGSQTPVTLENRSEFVRLYVHWLLIDSVSQQFGAFSRGFNTVCNSSTFLLFRGSEIELLICGEEALDFDELKKGTRYDNGYSEDHPIIQRFWEMALAFNKDQKRRFLMFTTGSDRAPIGGLSKLGLVIMRHAADEAQLPSSHTCFNVLLLPEYSSLELMQLKFEIALANAEGFGMK